jgi:hypothetical protein
MRVARLAGRYEATSAIPPSSAVVAISVAGSWGRTPTSEADFATYEGVLQIGLPPRRIDVLNRADGITFDEAVSAG